MSQVSAVRLAHALPLAFGLAFAWPEAADAGLQMPQTKAAEAASFEAAGWRSNAPLGGVKIDGATAVGVQPAP